MNVLVLGSGGREHAIVRALGRSPQKPNVFAAPGNPGIAQHAQLLEGVNLNDPATVTAAARTAEIDLVVVGPEVPLVAGVADQLAQAGIACFGPTAAAAALEGSKAFCKEIMIAAGVATADHTLVRTVEEGLAAITSYPAVLKEDGLAAGKGVVIAQDEETARAALQAMVDKQQPVLVEECLEGPELSVLAICDGETAIPLAPARDYKRLSDGDIGPNTGGMGAFSPVPDVDDDLIAEIIATVHQPVLREMSRRGTPFSGVLYAGLMLTETGPKTLEFNVRFGDPETQVVLPRLRTDLLELFIKAARPGGLTDVSLDWDDRSAVTVVLASAGYPVSPKSGDVITGIPSADADRQGTGESIARTSAADSADGGAEVEVMHAGTAMLKGNLTTAGGRVLNVTALANDLSIARDAAYATADKIHFPGKQLRRDIAQNVSLRVEINSSPN